MLQNRCDVHTHTSFSRHAYSTVRENVLAARDAGLELLGCADHFSDMLFPGADLGRASLRDYQFFLNTAVWPRTWEGVRLLHGAEADIRTLDGRLFGQDVAVAPDITNPAAPATATLYDRVVAGCDYVIASVHYRGFIEGASTAQLTDMYLRVMEQPKVLVLGHPGRANVPFDVAEVVGEAARRHLLVEINAHSFGGRRRSAWDRCRKIAETCAELGCQIVVSSDAHICADVGAVGPALGLLEEIHFPQELVATRSTEAFLAAMAAAGLEVPGF
ncbi:phosphatase [Thermophilibacter sp.]